MAIPPGKDMTEGCAIHLLTNSTIPTQNTQTMNKQTQAIGNDMERLAQDASVLLAATADIAGDKVGEARQRLANALDRGRKIYSVARDKALEGSHAADVAVHDNLYQTIAIGVGAGALIGFLLATRRTCLRH